MPYFFGPQEGSLAPNDKARQRKNKAKENKRRWLKENDPEGYQRLLEKQRENKRALEDRRRPVNQPMDHYTHTEEWLEEERRIHRLYPPITKGHIPHCLVPGCKNQIKCAGVCYKHHRDPAAREKYAIGRGADHDINPKAWELFCARVHERQSLTFGTGRGTVLQSNWRVR